MVTESNNYRSLGSAITPDTAGVRIDSYLGSEFPFFSRNAWKRRLDAGEVLVSGKSVRSRYLLRPGDVIQLYHPIDREPDVDDNIEVLYQNHGVMCIYKPSGLPMHEGGPYRKNTFSHVVREKIGPEWSAVHRLDRETSGIVVCCNNSEARDHIARQLSQKKVKKTYLAIALDEPSRKNWSVDQPIGDLEDSQIRIKKWVSADGQKSYTDFIVEDVAKGHCLLRALPKTGRTNQIRIHAAFSGHRLLGDKLYHPDESVFLKFHELGMNEEVEKAAGFKRCCLHAAEIEFLHPLLNEAIRVQCPLPPDMRELWDRLKNHPIVP